MDPRNPFWAEKQVPFHQKKEQTGQPGPFKRKLVQLGGQPFAIPPPRKRPTAPRQAQNPLSFYGVVPGLPAKPNKMDPDHPSREATTKGTKSLRNPRLRITFELPSCFSAPSSWVPHKQGREGLNQKRLIIPPMIQPCAPHAAKAPIVIRPLFKLRVCLLFSRGGGGTLPAIRTPANTILR